MSSTPLSSVADSCRPGDCPRLPFFCVSARYQYRNGLGENECGVRCDFGEVQKVFRRRDFEEIRKHFRVNFRNTVRPVNEGPGSAPYRTLRFIVTSMILINVRVCAGGVNPETNDDFILEVDQRLQPLEPDRTCEESVRIYEEHKQVSRTKGLISFGGEWCPKKGRKDRQDLRKRG